MRLYYFKGHSVTRTADIVAIAVRYQFVPTQAFITHKCCENTTFNQSCRKPCKLYHSMSFLDDIASLKGCEFK